MNWALHWILGFRFDNMAIQMSAIVITVSLLVHVYSLGYMHYHSRKIIYFIYLACFTLAMLGVVASDNFLFLFIFWELMGLASYLLIGFYFESERARKAAMKAFLVTRVGDVALLIGIAIIYHVTGSFTIQPITWPSHELALLGSFCILIGAMGKSAQFPFHGWLPDAMEGPSPVSALIHAATMVAAGIYLVSRSIDAGIFPPEMMMATVAVGTFTAIYAAIFAIGTDDLKRLLAYSTISQLGFMLAAAGMGATAAGFFHLTTHAFFKALLFLGAGAILHALHTRDIAHMGGLRTKIPIVFWPMLIASLALSGLPPFWGSASKNAILSAANDYCPYVHHALLATSGLTAFYIFRMIFRVFFGEAKHDVVARPPLTMIVPLTLLALLSIGVPNFEFTGAVAILGIFLAWMTRGKSIIVRPDPMDAFYNELAHGVMNLATAARQFDQSVIDRTIGSAAPSVRAISLWVRTLDDRVVDYVANGLADISQSGGKVLRRLHTGRIQDYAILTMAAVLLLAVLVSR